MTNRTITSFGNDQVLLLFKSKILKKKQKTGKGRNSFPEIFANFSWRDFIRDAKLL